MGTSRKKGAFTFLEMEVITGIGNHQSLWGQMLELSPSAREGQNEPYYEEIELKKSRGGKALQAK